MRAKKITMGLTVLALMGTMALPVSAQETEQTKDTTITANVQSTYTLSIPADTTVKFEATSTDLSGKLKVSGNVLPTQEVVVTAQADTFHNTAQNTDLPYKLMNGSEEFTTATWDENTLRAGLQEEQGTAIQLSIAIDESDWKTAEAGDYTGTITFTANLQDKQ